MFKTVGIVDLGQDDQAAAKDLYNAFANVGFCYIVNHGVPEELTEKMVHHAHEFFALPETIKNRIAKKHFVPENSNIYRGYFPLQLQADSYKEGFEVGADDQKFEKKTSQDKVFYEENYWPTSDNPQWDAEFRDVTNQNFNALGKLGARIMKLVALSFGEEQDYFVNDFTDQISTYRFLHYPLNDNLKKSALSCMEHYDTGVLTILYQDAFGGLQVENDQKEWIDVPFIKNSFVINLGRTLELWSGNKLRATNHRVLAVKGDRYSIPFFYEPAANALLKPLPHNTEGNKFEPITYGEFLSKHFMQFAEYKGQLGLA